MESKKVASRILSYYRSYKALTIGTIVYVLILGVLEIAPPKLIQYVVDNLLQEQDLSYLIMMSAVIFGVITARNLLGPGRHILRWKLTGNIVNDLRCRLHFHLQRQSISFFHQRQSGDIASRVVNDVNRVEQSLASVIETLPLAMVTLFGIAGVIFTTNARLALIATIPTVFIVALLYHYSKRVRPLFREIQRRSGEMNAYLFENIEGIKEVKAFTREDQANTDFSERSANYYSSRMRAVKYSSIYMQLLRYMGELGLILVIIFGGYEVLQGRLSAGGLTAFILYVRRYYQPLNQLSRINTQVQQGLASADRIFDLLDTEPRVEDPAHPVATGKPEGHIRIVNAGLQYPETNEYTLRNINLEITPKESIGIVGPTGGGKTSLISLITRFYDCTEGQVLIDGTDIRHFRQQDLRSVIGIVFQDPYLFNTTIEENIRFGKPQATPEELEKASRQAQIHEFVTGLDDGYQTIIGERGVKLSHGQKQRIAIARTLLQDPPILIFDEATSSVDNITESQIQQALENLLRDRTSLVIAHRLRTVEHVDRILVIEEGRISDQGTRDELLSRDNLYSSLRNLEDSG